jgi:RNA polymerase sigma factor (sigma-70 family)
LAILDSDQVMPPPFYELFDKDPVRAEQRIAELWDELVKFFVWKGCRTPEDAAQEVFVRAIRKIDEGAVITTPHIRTYFFGFARNLLLEGWKPSRETPLEPEQAERISAPDAGDIDDELDAKRLLERCLGVLSEPDRQLIVDYFTSDRDALAVKLGLSVENLRVKVHRIRKKVVAVAKLVEPNRAISMKLK